MTLPSFTATEYIALLITATVCLTVILTVAAIVIKRLKIRKITKDGITTGEDISVSPHKQCSHGRDWVQILAEHEAMLAEFYEKRFRIGQRQERHLKAEASKIRGQAQGVFLKLLKNTLNKQDRTGLLDHVDYKEYVRALKDTIDLVIPVILEDFDDDDIETMSDEAYHEYADKRALSILQTISDSLDDCYMGTVVYREDLFAENKVSIRSEIKHQIEEAYWQCRRLAKDTIRETEALRESFRQKLGGLI